MKKTVLVFSALTCLFIGRVTATEANLFNYDKNVVKNELTDLNKLENYVDQNKNVTLSELKSTNNSLISNINLNTNSSFGTAGMMEEPPLGIPSFLWGCIFSWVGLLVVVLIAKDSSETHKALMGCILNGVVWILYWVFWVLVIGNSFLL